MTVAIAGNSALPSGNSYTAAAGANRLMVYFAMASHGSGAAPAFTSATFGSTGMTQYGSTIVNATSRWGAVACWYLKEANIPAGSNLMSVVATTADPTILGEVYILSGVDQTNPFVANGSQVTTGGTSTALPSTSVEASGIAIIGFTSSEGWSGGETSACSGYTKTLTDQFDFSGVASSFYKLISGAGSEAPTVTTTANQNASALLVSIRQVAAAATSKLLSQLANQGGF